MTIQKEVLDELLKGQETPEDLFGVEGLLKTLGKALLERMLEGEMTTHFGVELSPTLVSNVTESVQEEVKRWQNRPLEVVYPILYLDALRVKVRENGAVKNKAV